MRQFGKILGGFLLLLTFAVRFASGANAVVLLSELLILTFLVFLVFEILPVTLICLIMLGIMPLLGISESFNQALSGFSNQVVFFILASFGIAAALTKVPLSKRFLRKMLRIFGGNSKTLTLAFMICAAVVSSVISNVPTCAVFLSIALEFLKIYEGEDRRISGRTMMIGIPVASMIGGIMTPAGSSINLLAISLLQEYTGTTIRFLQWMTIGIPIAVIILPVSWFILVSIFPPAEVDREKCRTFVENLGIPDDILPEEKRVLVIFGVMFACWLLSSWVTSINIMVVALLGCCVFCLPKIGVLTSAEFMQSVNWDSIFLVGTVLSMGTVLTNNGVSNQIALLFPSFNGVPKLFLLIYLALLIFVLLILIPVAPSLVTLMVPVVVQAATAAQIHPGLAVIVCAICACNCYLLPLDTVCLLSYSHGYYRMSDMTKVTVFIQLCLVLVSALWAFGIGQLFGWTSIV